MVRTRDRESKKGSEDEVVDGLRQQKQDEENDTENDMARMATAQTT